MVGLLQRPLAMALGLYFILWAAFFVPSAQAADPGDLDSTFGIGGVVTTSVGIASQGRDMAIQPDGKIIVAGATGDFFSNSDFALVRYLPDGTLDMGFGTGGIVTTSMNIDSLSEAVAIQEDGKIVVVGVVETNDPNDHFDLALARYEPDGQLDTGFGVGGKITTSVSSIYEFARDITIQDDGKIVVAGQSEFNNSYFTLVRYHSNGGLDTSFGAGGIVTTSLSINSYGVAVAIQEDGKIIVGGNSHNGTRGGFALARYDSGGNLDSSFGTNGTVTPFIGTVNHAIALQPDGKIVMAGYDGPFSDRNIMLIRFDTNGAFDSSFGVDGVVITALGDDQQTQDVAIQANGKIVVVGGHTNFTDNSAFLVARYSINGALDPDFGPGGVVFAYPGSGTNFGTAVVIQPDGKIVAAGNGSVSSSTFIAAVRYLGDKESETVHLPLILKE